MSSRDSFIVAAVMTLAAASLAASEVKVIANPSVGVSSVSAEEIRGVFLMTKASLSDGSRVEPVIAKGGPAHSLFLKDYLAKTDSALQTYYRSLVFTGKGSMPKLASDDAAVAEYVAKTKGAIGYVSSEASVSGVKILEVK